jgi:peroxiredoxin
MRPLKRRDGGRNMGIMTEEIEALRQQRAEAPRTRATVVGARAIQDLISNGTGEDAVKPGEAAPHFVLPNHNGVPVSLNELLTRGPVVISFYRGEWCPFCNLELRALQHNYSRIQELGASLVAISPQLPDGSLTVQERHLLEFPVLSDVGNRVAKSFGIVFWVPDDLLDVFEERGLHLSKVNGKDGAHELPIPATFVLRSDGTVHTAFVNADHTQRTDPDEIVRILESMTAK